MSAAGYGWRGRGAGLICALACVAAAADPTGREILEQQKARHDVASEVSHLTMQLHDRKGRVRERSLVTYVLRDAAGQYRSLLKFLAPADIRNVGLLTWEQAGAQKEDQWLYLPAARAVKRIAGTTRKGQFMGTDLAYEDLQPEELSRNRYTVLGRETRDGAECWKIEAVPAREADRDRSAYARRVLWIRRDDLLTMRIELYSLSAKLVKTIGFEDFVKVREKVWRANRVTYAQPLRKTKTVISVTARDLARSIPDSLLTQQGLRRPARP